MNVESTAPLLTRMELLILWEMQLISDDLSRMTDASSTEGQLELTEHGESIRRPRLSDREKRIARFLGTSIVEQLGGRVASDFAILTRAGIRVPTLVWLSNEQHEVKLANVLQTPPAACLEVMVSAREGYGTNYKIWAYLECGVKEVLCVSPEGRVAYHRADGAHDDSALGLKPFGHVTV